MVDQNSAVILWHRVKDVSENPRRASINSQPRSRYHVSDSNNASVHHAMIYLRAST